MRHRHTLLLLILAALAPASASAGVWNRLALSLNPGSLLSLRGNYSSTQTLKQAFLPGAGMGLGLRYKITNALFVDAGFSYNWMYMRQGMRPSDHYGNDFTTDKDAFVAPLYSLNLTLHPLPHSRISPYITAGGGVCPWWFSTSAFGGDLWLAPAQKSDNFTMVSDMANAGLGLELITGPRISIVTEVRYYHVFARNDYRFGKGGFANQDLLGIRLGITWYWGDRYPRKKVEEEEP